MERAFSILMFIFSGALLLYAGLMDVTKDYNLLPYRSRVSVKPKNPEKYMVQLAKIRAAFFKCFLEIRVHVAGNRFNAIHPFLSDKIDEAYMTCFFFPS